jgi:hypothetical protein
MHRKHVLKLSCGPHWKQQKSLVSLGGKAEEKNWQLYCPLGKPQARIFSGPGRGCERMSLLRGIQRLTAVKGTINIFFFRSAVHVWGLKHPPTHAYFTHFFHVPFILSTVILCILRKSVFLFNSDGDFKGFKLKNSRLYFSLLNLLF